MSFQKKSFVVGHFRGIVFASFFVLATFSPFLAFAGVLTIWQNTCDDWHGKAISFIVRGETYPDYCDTDANNYHYWQQFTDLDYTPTSTLSTINISNSWHLWAVSRNAVVPNVLYFESNGTSHFLSGGLIINNFNADIPTNYTPVYLIKYDNFAYTPIKQVDIYSGESVGGFYFLVYTDVDLSYINSQDTLYYYLDYLSNFNAITASSTPEQGLTLPAGTCDDMNVFAGALCRVITYLFYPEQASLTQYSELKDLIAMKPPFGYWTNIKNAVAGLSSTTTPAFALTSAIGSITIFDNLKTGLAWILWILFAFWIIKRIGGFEF